MSLTRVAETVIGQKFELVINAWVDSYCSKKLGYSRLMSVFLDDVGGGERILKSTCL